MGSEDIGERISYEKQYVIFITRICQENNKANQVKTLKIEN